MRWWPGRCRPPSFLRSTSRAIAWSCSRLTRFAQPGRPAAAGDRAGRQAARAGRAWLGRAAVVGSVSAPGGAAGGAGHRRHAVATSNAWASSRASTCGWCPARTRRRCCASSRCRSAFAQWRRTRPCSASRTSRAHTGSISPCWRWWRSSPARSWCSRSCRCRWPSVPSSSRCWACSVSRHASGSRWCSANQPPWGWPEACSDSCSAPCWRASRCGSWVATWAEATSPASRRRCTSPGPPR